eukprot:8872651-Pyramimonas_sp.AAC.2
MTSRSLAGTSLPWRMISSDFSQFPLASSIDASCVQALSTRLWENLVGFTEARASTTFFEAGFFSAAISSSGTYDDKSLCTVCNSSKTSKPDRVPPPVTDW